MDRLGDDGGCCRDEDRFLLRSSSYAFLRSHDERDEETEAEEHTERDEEDNRLVMVLSGEGGVERKGEARSVSSFFTIPLFRISRTLFLRPLEGDARVEMDFWGLEGEEGGESEEASLRLSPSL